ncbi:hypothetical protein F1188_03640 [Roseospira marina]|uniref:Uncharacterized protein n=1 Tax=Roseospira marina TaxID=140057 RepID=A0A5M6IFF3_9PROT|nr:hypothetical protein [Roseospira marina]KAA5607010.1 hypothetical protein F1188_03640 [Roseospira marina]MBB4312806.1 hypothetical protein [Roseospira marina]MBB5086421.1 hypothetical protein [Roseospira marina]
MPTVECCALWRDAATIARARLADHFERTATLFEDSHAWRYLLTCRDCGQAYVFDFFEEIDWSGGNDPQFKLWVPVPPGQDPLAMAREDRNTLLERTPRLHSDWPADAPQPRIHWVRTPPPAPPRD